jgi:hypothetical protein
MTTTTPATQPIPSSTTWRSGNVARVVGPAAARLVVALLLALALGPLAAGALAAAPSELTATSMEDPSGSSSNADAAASVLTGQVLIGPTCPLARPNPPPGCADRPYQASISIQTPDGAQEVAQVDTDDQGVFSIDVSPGDYLVVPLTPPGNILPRGEPQLVSVAPGVTVTLVLHFDSGLR